MVVQVSRATLHDEDARYRQVVWEFSESFQTQLDNRPGKIKLKKGKREIKRNLIKLFYAHLMCKYLNSCILYNVC